MIIFWDSMELSYEYHAKNNTWALWVTQEGAKKYVFLYFPKNYVALFHLFIKITKTPPKEISTALKIGLLGP